MKRLYALAVLTAALALLLAVPVLAFAQCCGQSSAAPPVVAPLVPHNPAQIAAGYVWQRHPSDPGRIYLYRDGVQIGGYDLTQNYYQPCLDARLGIWGNPADEPPVALPAEHARRAAPVLNFGVDVGKMAATEVTGAAKYKLITPDGNYDVNQKQALDLAEKGPPDDANKLRLTVIGSDTERAPAVQALKADSGLMAKANLWDAAPTHWALKDSKGKGFVTSGHPTVYLTDATGKVLYHEDTFRPGDLQAIRKAADGYDPKKDPGRTVPLAPVAPLVLAKLPLPLLGGGAAALAGLAAFHGWRRWRSVPA